MKAITLVLTLVLFCGGPALANESVTCKLEFTSSNSEILHSVTTYQMVSENGQCEIKQQSSFVDSGGAVIPGGEPVLLSTSDLTFAGCYYTLLRNFIPSFGLHPALVEQGLDFTTLFGHPGEQVKVGIQSIVIPIKKVGDDPFQGDLKVSWGCK